MSASAEELRELRAIVSCVRVVLYGDECENAPCEDDECIACRSNKRLDAHFRLAGPETTRSGKVLFECSGCGARDPAPAKDHECRVKRLKLDPDLADGEHWTIHDKPNPVLLELLAAWFDEAQPGEAITLECVEMTDQQVEELPDI